MTVLVSVRADMHRNPPQLLAAVESVLAQTHTDLVCLIVADGVADPPELDELDDPRLIRYRLIHDRGTHHVDKIAASAAAAADGDWWWTPHDQHDIAEPGRLAALLAHAGPDTSAVLGGHTDAGGVEHQPRPPTTIPRLVETAHRAGLWRPTITAPIISQAYRTGYAPVMTTAAAAFGAAAFCDDTGYHDVTVDPATEGAYARAVQTIMRRFWSEHVLPNRDGLDLVGFASLVSHHLPNELADEITFHADRVTDLLAVGGES